MRVRRRWREALLAVCAGGTLFGASCKDTVRATLFQEALGFVSGQVNTSLLDVVPVDDIIGNLLTRTSILPA